MTNHKILLKFYLYYQIFFLAHSVAIHEFGIGNLVYA